MVWGATCLRMAVACAHARPMVAQSEPQIRVSPGVGQGQGWGGWGCHFFLSRCCALYFLISDGLYFAFFYFSSRPTRFRLKADARNKPIQE